jgi:hypothetical protein
VRGLKPFENPNDPFLHKYRNRPAEPKPEPLTAQLRKMLALAPWLHGPLNDWMKRYHQTARIVSGFETVQRVDGSTYKYPQYKAVGPHTARTLKGMGDIDAFVFDVALAANWSSQTYHPSKGWDNSEGKYHPEWMEALKSFVDGNYQRK